MPFITEEIYQALPHDCKSIMIAPWPVADPSLVDKDAEKAMTAIMDAIKAIREMRAQVNAAPGKKAPAILLAEDGLRDTIAANANYFQLLATVDTLTVLPLEAEKPENAMAAIQNGVEVYLPLKGLIDVELETARLNKEKTNLEKELKRVQGKLGNAGFLSKAPAAVVEKEKAKAEEYTAKLKTIDERLAYLKTL
jgi:valyl-tRNA synthetase